MNHTPSLPAAVDRAYELWLWIDQRIADFPTFARHSLGERTLDTAIDVLDALVRAAFAGPHGGARVEALTQANHRLTMLNLLLRGARDRRHLSVSQHEHAMRATTELGRMIGAWLRRSRSSR